MPTFHAFDTETYRIVDGLLAPKMVCLSHWGEFDAHGQVLTPDEGTAWLADRLADPDVHLIGHNVAFDVAVACREDPSLMQSFLDAYEEGRVRDTLVRQKLIQLAKGRLDFEPNRQGGMSRVSYSLAALVDRHLGIDIGESKKSPDAWRTRYHELDGVPVEDWPDDAYEYARDDAGYTLAVFLEQGEPFSTEVGPVSLDDEELSIVNEDMQTRADLALHLSSCWGMRTDDRVHEWAEETTHFLDELAGPLREAGILRDNDSKSLKRLRALVEAAYDGDPPVTDSGNVSYAKDTVRDAPYVVRLKRDDDGEFNAVKNGRAHYIEAGDQENVSVVTCKPSELREDEVDILGQYIDWNAKRHLRDTYLPALKDGLDRPVNPRYDFLRETGRTSCSDPNLQNMPREGGIRECFTARPGRLFCFCDYDSFEFRALGQTCLDLFGRSKIVEVATRGDQDDFHLDFAARMLGIDYTDAETRLENGDKEVKQARSYAKVANYGFPGGLVPSSFVEYAADFGLQLDEDRAEELYEDWLAHWPEMPEFFDYVDNKCGFGGRYTLLQPRTHRQRGDTRYTAACNSYFQGPAADAAKRALWRLTQAFYSRQGGPLAGSRLAAFVHDECVVEVPREGAAEAAEEVRRLMCEGAEEILEDVPITAEPALAARWYKDAEPVRGPDGRLQEWTPDLEAA